MTVLSSESANIVPRATKGTPERGKGHGHADPIAGASSCGGGRGALTWICVDLGLVEGGAGTVGDLVGQIGQAEVVAAGVGAQ